jgi:hypothetical protein
MYGKTCPSSNDDTGLDVLPQDHVARTGAEKAGMSRKSQAGRVHSHGITAI